MLRLDQSRSAQICSDLLTLAQTCSYLIIIAQNCSDLLSLSKFEHVLACLSKSEQIWASLDLLRLTQTSSAFPFYRQPYEWGSCKGVNLLGNLMNVTLVEEFPFLWGQTYPCPIAAHMESCSTLVSIGLIWIDLIRLPWTCSDLLRHPSW